LIKSRRLMLFPRKTRPRRPRARCTAAASCRPRAQETTLYRLRRVL
jgi:hypothetical protein